MPAQTAAQPRLVKVPMMNRSMAPVACAGLQLGVAGERLDRDDRRQPVRPSGERPPRSARAAPGRRSRHRPAAPCAARAGRRPGADVGEGEDAAGHDPAAQQRGGRRQHDGEPRPRRGQRRSGARRAGRRPRSASTSPQDGDQPGVRVSRRAAARPAPATPARSGREHQPEEAGQAGRSVTAGRPTPVGALQQPGQGRLGALLDRPARRLQPLADGLPADRPAARRPPAAGPVGHASTTSQPAPSVRRTAASSREHGLDVPRPPPASARRTTCRWCGSFFAASTAARAATKAVPRAARGSVRQGQIDRRRCRGRRATSCVRMSARMASTTDSGVARAGPGTRRRPSGRTAAGSAARPAGRSRLDHEVAVPA